MRLKLSSMARLLTVALLVGALPAMAEIELMLWVPVKGGPAIVLPHKKGRSLQSSLNEYVEKVTTDPELDNLFSEESRARLRQQSLNAFELRRMNAKDLDSSREISFINANRVRDMFPEEVRINNVSQIISSGGGKPFVVALSAEDALSQSEIFEFHAQLNKHGNVMAGLGGRDLHPKHYGEEITDSVTPNYKNDGFELERVKSFKKAGRGVYMGFCRGHQLGAVADGHSLYQDIENYKQAKRSDHGRDGANSRESQAWHHVTITDSFLLAIVKEALIETNSLHHQSVRVSEHGLSFPVAYAGKIVEALQAFNGLSYTWQFHPEFLEAISGSRNFSEMGTKIIHSVLAYSRWQRIWRSPTGLRCRGLFIKMI